MYCLFIGLFAWSLHLVSPCLMHSIITDQLKLVYTFQLNVLYIPFPLSSTIIIFFIYFSSDIFMKIYMVNIYYIYTLIGSVFLELFLSNMASALDRLLTFCRSSPVVGVLPWASEQASWFHFSLISPFQSYMLGCTCQELQPCIHRSQDCTDAQALSPRQGKEPTTFLLIMKKHTTT
jgi:hypothetical protein